MVEHVLDFISQLTPFWIYVALFAFAFIENIFPPAPGDVVMVVGGTLIAAGPINFIPTLLLTAAGSVLGFMTYYYIGTQLDRKVIRTGKMRFISLEALEKAEAWFNKYGYRVILINRFLPGTRSVISFFAGLSELNLKKTLFYATISALIWNSIIIYLGILFGNNIKTVDYYLSTYSRAAVIISIIFVLVMTGKYFWDKKKKNKN